MGYSARKSDQGGMLALSASTVYTRGVCPQSRARTHAISAEPEPESELARANRAIRERTPAMKVILLQDVPGLGKPGDVKEVANGYARNYLLPRQLVTAATPGELANLQQRVKAAQRRVEKQRQEHESLATRLASVSLTFAVRVGRGDRLYGSVTNQDIANALQEQEGLTIDRRAIQLHEPIRTLGTFEVPVRIAPKVEPKVKVTLVPSQQAAQGEEQAPAAEEAAPAEGKEATSAEA